MNTRPSWDSYFTQIASIVSTRSTCQKHRVGCVIVDNHHEVVSTGYNGVRSGKTHCVDIIFPCDNLSHREWSKKNEVHAEVNAISVAKKNRQSLHGCTLYTTHAPCFDCSTVIAQNGISKVYYTLPYRDMKGIEFLLSREIKCFHYS